jgi:hypothetical protein
MKQGKAIRETRSGTRPYVFDLGGTRAIYSVSWNGSWRDKSPHPKIRVFYSNVLPEFPYSAEFLPVSIYRDIYITTWAISVGTFDDMIVARYLKFEESSEWVSPADIFVREALYITRIDNLLFSSLDLEKGTILKISGKVVDNHGVSEAGQKFAARVYSQDKTIVFSADVISGTEGSFEISIETVDMVPGDYSVLVIADLVTINKTVHIRAPGEVPIVTPPIPPPVTPPIPPTTVPVLPPFPADPDCLFPTLSLNFIDVVSKLIKWIGCRISHIIMILVWFKDAIVAAFDFVMQFISYFVSLKWLTDFIAKFFDALDTWLSAKFGIEKDKPFLDELLKKFMSWLLSFLDNAAENDKKNW